MRILIEFKLGQVTGQLLCGPKLEDEGVILIRFKSDLPGLTWQHRTKAQSILDTRAHRIGLTVEFPPNAFGQHRCFGRRLERKFAAQDFTTTLKLPQGTEVISKTRLQPHDLTVVKFAELVMLQNFQVGLERTDPIARLLELGRMVLECLQAPDRELVSGGL